MTPHPAKFNDSILHYLKKGLRTARLSLDPFAGVGRIFEIDTPGTIIGVEIEEEWAVQAPVAYNRIMIVSDFFEVGFSEEQFDYIATSPTYGNRMADHHDAKDGSVRNTYKHKLGRDLTENNSGMMQWGPEYREFHTEAWKRCARYLVRGGSFILNIKDHIRKGEQIEVSKWHVGLLKSLGLSLVLSIQIPATGNRFGANFDKRLDYENLFIMEKL